MAACQVRDKTVFSGHYLNILIFVVNKRLVIIKILYCYIKMDKNSWTYSILCNVYITAVYNIAVYTAEYVEKQSILR